MGNSNVTPTPTIFSDLQISNINQSITTAPTVSSQLPRLPSQAPTSASDLQISNITNNSISDRNLTIANIRKTLASYQVEMDILQTKYDITNDLSYITKRKFIQEKVANLQFELDKMIDNIITPIPTMKSVPMIDDIDITNYMNQPRDLLPIIPIISSDLQQSIKDYIYSEFKFKDGQVYILNDLIKILDNIFNKQPL